jgi:hypothetical protein
VANRSGTAKAQLKVRCPEPLRARLEASAKHHEWSLNSEIVLRLEGALFQGDIAKTIFGDEEIFAAVYVIAQVIRQVQKIEGKKLKDDFRNILQKSVDLVIRFTETARQAISNRENSGGMRDVNDAAIFAMMLQTLIDAVPPEDLESLMGQGRVVAKES